jgi:ATP synthase protein I
MGKTIGKKIVVLWGCQLTGLLVVTASLWWIDSAVAYSVLIGGLIYWIPNAYFTLYAFRYKGARAASAVLHSIYRGEVGKFVLTAVGFALAFVFVKPLDIISLFLAYVVVMLSQWYLVGRW